MGQKVSGELPTSGCIQDISGSLSTQSTALSSRKGPSKRCRTSSTGSDDLHLSCDLRLEILLERCSWADREGQLAHAWNPDDRSPCIRIRRDDPLTLRRLPVQDTTDAIRGRVGFSKGLHAWTIRWKSDQRGTHAVIGVATADAPLRTFGYKCLIGNNEDSWGWDIVKNRLWHNGKSLPGLVCPQNASPCQITGQTDRAPLIPDEVIVILDMEKGTMSFAVDGRYLGVAFTGLKGKTLYPAISAVWGHCQVSIKFLGSIDPSPVQLSELCRRVIRQQIGKYRLDNDDEGLKQLPLPPLLIQYLR